MPRISTHTYFKQFPRLMKCLEYVASQDDEITDWDWRIILDAIVPVDWLIAVRAAEYELSRVKDKDLKAVAVGNLADKLQDTYPLVDWILTEAFEGRLSSIIYDKRPLLRDKFDDEDIPF